MNRLINTKFRTIFRVLDMMCINFGEQTIYRSVMPEFSLHLQTQWRFRNGDTVLLGSRDIYTPFSEDVDTEDWDYSLIGRPDCDSSIFDVVSRQLASELKGHHVISSTMTPYGDILITFSNGYLLEVFIPTSAKEEEWRLIDCSSGEHFIFHETDDNQETEHSATT